MPVCTYLFCLCLDCDFGLPKELKITDDRRSILVDQIVFHAISAVGRGKKIGIADSFFGARIVLMNVALQTFPLSLPLVCKIRTIAQTTYSL
jgi:hypothetical protein